MYKSDPSNCAGDSHPTSESDPWVLHALKQGMQGQQQEPQRLLGLLGGHVRAHALPWPVLRVGAFAC